MNPRKVRCSCVVICLSVLLGSSWYTPAVAGDAAVRLAAGPNWGGAGNPTPVPVPSAKTKPGVMAVKASEPWDVLWMDVWQKSNGIYRIGVSDTLKQVKGCTGNLGLEVIVEQTVRAVRDRKFGDAVRWMSQFQDRSLCLHYEGARGLEVALSRYVERAIKELPADQQRIAIHGTFNLGMLAYDQISYTKKSWWQGIVGSMYYPQMVAQMNAYPAKELGLWSYNFENGRLVQSASKQSLLDKLATLADPNFIGGTKAGGGSGAAGGGGSGSDPAEAGTPAAALRRVARVRAPAPSVAWLPPRGVPAAGGGSPACKRPRPASVRP